MTFPAGQLPPDVLKAIQSGRTIDAIKRLRKSTGLGLAEAKAVIDAHLRNQPPPVPTFGGGGAAANTPDGGRILPEAVLEALQRGDKNAAAQLLRERLGLSLKAAKKRIDSAGGTAAAPGGTGSVFDSRAQEMPHLDHRIVAPPPQVIQSRPGLAPGEVAHSNGAFWLFLALVVALVAYLAIF
jgi:ribosomal protein L7/L12